MRVRLQVRIQETQAELPRGSIPRSLEVVLRAEAVETAQAGDRCDFTGTLIVVPDVSQLRTPGAFSPVKPGMSGGRPALVTRVRCLRSRRASGEQHPRGRRTAGLRVGGRSRAEGSGGPGALLQTGLPGLQRGSDQPTSECSHVLVVGNPIPLCAPSPMRFLLQFGGKEIREEEQTAESIKSQMTEKEWEKVFEMSQDKNLYHNLCSSLFPTIHGGSAPAASRAVARAAGIQPLPRLCRERRGEARHPADAVRRRSQNDHGGNLAERRHQRVRGGRPQHGQESVPEVGTRRSTLRRRDSQIIRPSPPSARFRHVEEFSPRAVYTSGKASSAAGLTAAVVRDEESHEFVIEAGALMLADNVSGGREGGRERPVGRA